ncbi:hypothetical protein FAGAP_9975 [Fusarium agapanthi]|uniref:Uncharacterized protein n=1 Tax=Fusarium agapanthi TaxID=1803897 RepID=A0A9P5B8G3_9HYPO|nr:hypothetical protein FAGAP_9975 [Fusarium agapanthi]
MGSTEDSMDISFNAQSPSITPTLNSLQTQHESPSSLITPSLDRVDISQRTHDESPPLTPVSNDADISLPTHYGTSSHPSPEWSLVSQQQDQQIRSQFDQLLHHQTSATTDNLVKDTADFGVLLSLASIVQTLFPDTRISSLIKESKEMPLLLFILDKLYRLRQELQMQDRYL